MRIFERLESRFEDKLQEKLDETSRAVATIVVDSLLEESSSPFAINIGEKPRRIGKNDYIERINTRVECRLARVGMDHLVYFDEEATNEANSFEVDSTDVGKFKSEAKDLSIVYSKF